MRPFESGESLVGSMRCGALAARDPASEKVDEHGGESFVVYPLRHRDDIDILVVRPEFVDFRAGNQAMGQAADLQGVGIVVARNDAGRHGERPKILFTGV